MRCIQCEAALPDDSRFCSSCGAKQPETAIHPERENSGASSQATLPEQAGTNEVPPPIEEPIAVRLTKGSVRTNEMSASRHEAVEEEPPQMRPVLPESTVPHRMSTSSTAALDRSASSSHVRSARQEKKGRNIGVWILPPLLAVCAAGALIWQTGYERDISTEAAEIQRSAADAALGGNYEIAESKLNLALEKRPEHSGIRSDLETVQTIRRLDDRLTEAQRMISKSNAAGAAAVLDDVQQELAGLSGGAYSRLRSQLDKLREKMELVGIRSDAERADTLDELGGLMKTAADYPAADKDPVLELITARIVKVGGDEAEQAIANGSYYEAAAVVDEARSYAPEAKRLIELDKQISLLASDSQSALQELKYLSGSELAAGTGELRMNNFEQHTSEGKLVFSGMLSNISNDSVYDLLIEFRSYDAQGMFQGEGWTEVLPRRLKPGETTVFTDEVLSAKGDSIVVIDSVSWYRE